MMGALVGGPCPQILELVEVLLAAPHHPLPALRIDVTPRPFSRLPTVRRVPDVGTDHPPAHPFGDKEAGGRSGSIGRFGPGPQMHTATVWVVGQDGSHRHRCGEAAEPPTAANLAASERDEQSEHRGVPQAVVFS